MPNLSSPNHSIPIFSLYGEDQWPTPDLLHWESVAQRSAVHNWLIKAHRHSNLWQFLYLEKGQATANIDGKEQRLTLPCVLVIPQLCVHGFEFSPDIEGHVVTLAVPLIQSIANNLTKVDRFLYSPAVLPVDKENYSILNKLLNTIAAEYTLQNDHREFALQLLISQLALWIVRQDNNLDKGEMQDQNGKRYFSTFMQLVEQRFRDHEPLDNYAKSIGVSTPHLNSICRQYSGQSALQVIHQRLLLEAKRNLVYTVMTVSDISNALGFSEPPYFTRFFKRLTGVAPNEFRKQQ